MSEEEINLMGETCPVPLVETRKAIRKASEGTVIEVSGDHPASKKEIPMAVEEMGYEVLDIEEEGDNWTIKIKVEGED